MKLTKAVGGVLLLALAQACGGTEDAGADLGKFVGKWTYQPGAKVMLMCGQAPIDMPVSGSLTISAGTAGDLMVAPSESDCALPFSVVGAAADLKAPMECTMSGFKSMVTKWRVTTTDGSSGESAFSAKASGMFGGMMIACDVMGSGRMAKTP